MSDEKRSLRLRLREETADLHARVDTLGGQLAPVSTAHGYRTFLGAMRKVTTRCALLLDRSSELAGIEPRAGLLSAALSADLTDLVRFSQPPAWVPRPTPRQQSVELPLTDGTAWGVGYALEGSALGAALLLNEVRSSNEPMPTAYLSMLTEQRPQRWSSFIASLNGAELLDGAGTSSAVIDAATSVFQLVEAAFIDGSTRTEVAHGP